MEFKIFESHNSEYKTSYVMGNYCLNGYRFFHKNEAKNFFKEFEFPEEFQQDILNAFSDDPIPDYDPEIYQNINERIFFANLGRDKDLDILVYDEESCVRVEVAKHWRPKDLDILVN